MLVAEVIVSELAHRVGLRTPRLVALDLDPEIARYEADEEVQDLLTRASGSTSASTSCPAPSATTASWPPPTPRRATVLWLDAFTANVDRSWKNPNLLVWHGDLWVIDHGASLYFHHGWAGGVSDPDRFARQPWDITDHVIEHPRAARSPRRDARDRPAARRRTCSPRSWTQVPDAWLEPVPGAETPRPSCGRRTSRS